MKNLCTFVKLNHSDIWKKLEIEPQVTDEIIVPQTVTTDDNECTSSTDCSNSSDNNYNKVSESIKLSIILSPDEWDRIKPPSWKRSTLLPNVWISVINDPFWDMTSLDCYILYKRANVKQNSFLFLEILGRCKNCVSRIRGVLEKNPCVGRRGIINCRYDGDFGTCK